MLTRCVLLEYAVDLKTKPPQWFVCPGTGAHQPGHAASEAGGGGGADGGGCGVGAGVTALLEDYEGQGKGMVMAEEDELVDPPPNTYPWSPLELIKVDESRGRKEASVLASPEGWKIGGGGNLGMFWALLFRPPAWRGWEHHRREPPPPWVRRLQWGALGLKHGHCRGAAEAGQRRHCAGETGGRGQRTGSPNPFWKFWNPCIGGVDSNCQLQKTTIGMVEFLELCNKKTGQSENQQQSGFQIQTKPHPGVS